MNLNDNLRLAEEHVKHALSSGLVIIEPYCSLLKACSAILSVVRVAYGLPSPLPITKEDEDWLSSFDNDLSHGMSSTHIDF